MRDKAYHKFMYSREEAHWKDYKIARNEANKFIKSEKQKFFEEEININKHNHKQK